MTTLTSDVFVVEVVVVGSSSLSAVNDLLNSISSTMCQNKDLDS